MTAPRDLLPHGGIGLRWNRSLRLHFHVDSRPEYGSVLTSATGNLEESPPRKVGSCDESNTTVKAAASSGPSVIERLSTTRQGAARLDPFQFQGTVR